MTNQEPASKPSATPTTRSNEEEELFTCTVCEKKLPRGNFSKKTVKKQVYICQHCRKAATAARCQQPAPRQNKQGQKGRRSASGIHRRPNNWGYCDYVDKIFSMGCFPDLVQIRVFASAKDVSESMAALQAVKHLKNQKDAFCLCVGDGSTPRTAVLASYLHQWEQVVSIDPALQDQWVGKEPNGVQNLVGFQGTLQEYMAQPETVTSCSHLVILLVHSHARFIGPCSVGLVRAKFGTPPTTLVSLPCCTRFRHTQDLHFAPSIQYEDDCVFSACRTVQVWNYDEGGHDNNSTPELILCQAINNPGESDNYAGRETSLGPP